MTVAEFEIFCGECLNFQLISQHLHRSHRVAEPAFARASVHDESAADCSRNTDECFDARESVLGGLFGKCRHHRAGTDGDVSLLKNDRTKIALQMQHEAANAFIGHEQVGAGAEEKVGRRSDAETRRSAINSASELTSA